MFTDAEISKAADVILMHARSCDQATFGITHKLGLSAFLSEHALDTHQDLLSAYCTILACDDAAWPVAEESPTGDVAPLDDQRCKLSVEIGPYSETAAIASATPDLLASSRIFWISAELMRDLQQLAAGVSLNRVKAERSAANNLVAFERAPAETPMAANNIVRFAQQACALHYANTR